MDPMTCQFDPASVQCAPNARSTASCLTATLVAAARKLYSGARDAQGELMYPGWQVPGSELNWVPWVVPAPGSPFTIDPTIALNTIRYLAYRGIDPRLGLTDIPFTAAGFRQIMAATGAVFDATNPDLAAFRDDGGKLLLYHGLADPGDLTDRHHRLLPGRRGPHGRPSRHAEVRAAVPDAGHVPLHGRPGPELLRRPHRHHRLGRAGHGTEYWLGSFSPDPQR
jgi:hypothetical protein